jgi:hypothetical protein
MMRTRLTKALSIRTTPFIQFQMDEDLKKELAMMELLDKVAKENAELDRKRAEAAAAAGAPPGESETGDGADANTDAAKDASRSETTPDTKSEALNQRLES